jgi:polyisoprenoid-binding protein YceI
VKEIVMKALIPYTLLLMPGLAQAATWEIDSAHSAAQFAVKHMMVSTVRGEFSNVKGTINLDDKDPAKMSVEATVDATTVNTREPARDKHLKSPDFFDVAKYPAISFKSTSVKKKGASKFAVTGELTLHGVTKPATLDVDMAAEVKDPWGKVRRGAQATTKISRKDYGLAWNKALETGGVVVGDEINITLDIEATKQAVATPEAAAERPAGPDKKPAATTK